MESLLEWGYWGLFVGSFLASTIIPFSSDLLLVGILAAGGNVWICLAVATVGNWLGGLTCYGIGWAGNVERIDRWTNGKIDKVYAFKPRVERWGAWLALLAWLPVVGDVISIALGFFRTSPVRTSLWMLLGRFVRFLFWSLLFYFHVFDFMKF